MIQELRVYPLPTQSPYYASYIAARYLNDLWLFDTQEYRWMQVDLGVGVGPSYASLPVSPCQLN